MEKNIGVLGKSLGTAEKTGFSPENVVAASTKIIAATTVVLFSMEKIIRRTSAIAGVVVKNRAGVTITFCVMETIF